LNPSKRGLIAILVATVIAGGLGYLIQALVPVWLNDPGAYLQFSVFWSTTFLLVSLLSGVQQEVTRAVRPVDVNDLEVGLRAPLRAGISLFRAGAIIACAVILLMVTTAALWGPLLFSTQAYGLVGAMTLALVGYLIIAILSGEFYGLGRFSAVAATTVADAVVRAILVLVPLVLGLGLLPIAYGVAMPFLITAVCVWGVSRRGSRGKYRLDVSIGRLLRNSGQAMLGALATGILISGLPSVLKFTSSGLGEGTLAALILALTLSRAPLVVPLLALQSYLVVLYRNMPTGAMLRAIRLMCAVFVATAILAFAVWWIGRDLLLRLYEAELVLDGGALAMVVASGGATAALCVVAPVLLAQGMHGRFLAAWATSAGTTAFLLTFLGDSLPATIVAIALGPLVGCVLSLVMLRQRQGSLELDINPDSERPAA